MAKNDIDQTIEQEEAPQDVPVIDDAPRPVSLDFFATTNSWRIDHNGTRVTADELMGGFVYQMRLQGQLAATEGRYREAFELFCAS